MPRHARDGLTPRATGAIVLITSASPVLRLSSNRVGRDFVIGDVCGDFEAVLEAMREAAFDSARDRVFSVGHLTGGCESTAAFLRFLRHPAVYAVRTDAEQDALDLFAEGEPEEASVLALGAAIPALEWISAADPAARRQVIDAIRRLPVAISVGEVRTEHGFVHAGAPDGLSWEQFLAALANRDGTVTQDALRGAGTAAAEAVRGVGRVFVCFSHEHESDATNIEAGVDNVVVVPPGTELLRISRAENRTDKAR